MLQVEIIIEPFVRSGADIHLDVVKEVHDRTRGQMRGGMPPHFIGNGH